MPGLEQSHIIATAGHVDHGKSALVKALTGTDPDRLPEEKARGMTIDLGYADLTLPVSSFSGPVRIGFIDVPGHEDFLRNMIAGVTACDAALLVVAANEGWMPQTEEHLQILGCLGVPQCMVVLAKADLVTPNELADVEMAVLEQLRRTPYEGSSVASASALTAAGMNVFRERLAGFVSSLAPARDIGKPRLYCDRAFSRAGTGTIVTGTLVGGELALGERVQIEPGGLEARIRGMQSYHDAVERASPGRRVALNLAGIAVDAPGRPGVRRGDVVGRPGAIQNSACWDVSLSSTWREALGAKRPDRVLPTGATVRVHHGTRQTFARCVIHGCAALEPGQHCIAQLRFASPVAGFVGDRFVLRDEPGRHTLAGGVILDSRAERKGFHQSSRQESLALQAGDGKTARAVIRAVLKRKPILDRAGLLACSNFSKMELEEAVQELQTSGAFRITGRWLIEEAAWNQYRKAMLRAVDDFHVRNPEAGGMRRDALKGAVGSAVPELILPELVENLAGQELCVDGPEISRASFQPSLAPQRRTAALKVGQVLAEAGLKPPPRVELAVDDATRTALEYLLRTGSAIELSPEVVLDSKAYAAARQAVCVFLATRTSATLGELRQALGTTRRVAVPLLEKLDAEGVTRREEDRRVLNGKS